MEGSKTLNYEKKPREASLRGCFGRGRRIFAPHLKSDTGGLLARMHVQCAVVGRPSSVTWSQTSLNTLLKDLRANYAACYSSKQDTASLSGWNGLFYSFLRCEENGTGLPECTELEYFGGH